MADFSILERLQRKLQATALQMRRGLVLPTAHPFEYRQKISHDVCSLRSDCVARHAVLKERVEFKGSRYEEEGVFESLLGTCSSILDWLEKELPMSPVSHCRWRRFWRDYLTDYLDEYEELLEEDDLCGLDFDFIRERIEIYYSRFIVHNVALSVVAHSDFVRRQLEEDRVSLSSRIVKYFLSVNPSSALAIVQYSGFDNVVDARRSPIIVSTAVPVIADATGFALTVEYAPANECRIMDLKGCGDEAEVRVAATSVPRSDPFFEGWRGPGGLSSQHLIDNMVLRRVLIILVGAERLARANWLLGRVVEALPDHHVRGAAAASCARPTRFV